MFFLVPFVFVPTTDFGNDVHREEETITNNEESASLLDQMSRNLFSFLEITDGNDLRISQAEYSEFLKQLDFSERRTVNNRTHRETNIFLVRFNEGRCDRSAN